MHTYSTVAPRIGAIKGKMLQAAMPREVLGITGELHKINKNESDTVIFGRWVARGGAANDPNNWDIDPATHAVADGVTPTADSLLRQDISVTLQEYACLYKYTKKSAELYEDKIPDGMKEQAGSRMGLVREMIRYGALQGCSNKFYQGGAARANVDGVPTLAGLRAITRSLEDNRCDSITKVLASTPNYKTEGLEAGFLVFAHSDCEQDFRDMPGFTSVRDYGSSKQMVHPRELGAVEKFRIVTSPELKPIAGAGGTVGAGIKRTIDDADVYPIIVVGKDAWGDVALRGKESFDVVHVPYDSPDKMDPLGQYGFVGAHFYAATFIQNDFWMAVYETAVTEL